MLELRVAIPVRDGVMTKNLVEVEYGLCILQSQLFSHIALYNYQARGSEF